MTEHFAKIMHEALRPLFVAEASDRLYQTLLSIPDPQIIGTIEAFLRAETDSQRNVLLDDLCANLTRTPDLHWQDLAIAHRSVEFVSKTQNADWCKILAATPPTDLFKLNEGEDDYFMQYWNQASKTVTDDGKIIWKDSMIPSDLLFGGMISIHDTLIQVTRHDSVLDLVGTYIARVKIFDDYVKRIELNPDASDVDIGLMVIYYPKDMTSPQTLDQPYRFIMPLRITRGVNAISSNMQFGWMGFPDELIPQLSKETPLGVFMSQISSFLLTWYGLQVGLLHPPIKHVICSGSRSRIREMKKYNQIPVRKPVFTCRVHNISLADVKDARKQADIDRKTMLWYVIGHWRYYANGKQVFVKPYWKGPLRGTKQNTETRERILPVKEENHEEAE